MIYQAIQYGKYDPKTKWECIKNLGIGNVKILNLCLGLKPSRKIWTQVAIGQIQGNHNWKEVFEDELILTLRFEFEDKSKDCNLERLNKWAS